MVQFLGRQSSTDCRMLEHLQPVSKHVMRLHGGFSPRVMFANWPYGAGGGPLPTASPMMQALVCRQAQSKIQQPDAAADLHLVGASRFDARILVHEPALPFTLRFVQYQVVISSLLSFHVLISLLRHPFALPSCSI